MSDQTLASFGDFDGEPIDATTIKLSGTVRFSRRLQEGERVVLIIEGTTKADINIRRKDGQLVRGHTITIDYVGEPAEHLAEEAEAFLKLMADAEANRTPLPFGEEEPDSYSDPACICERQGDVQMVDPDCPIHGGDWEYQNPDPQPPDPGETETEGE